MFSIKVNPDSVVMLTVESRDMQKNPFLFFIFTFKAVEIEVRYTIPLDSSQKMRKLYIIKNHDRYHCDYRQFFCFSHFALPF